MVVEECVLYGLTFVIGAIFGAYVYHSDKEFDLKVYNFKLKFENEQLRERIKICEEKSMDLRRFEWMNNIKL